MSLQGKTKYDRVRDGGGDGAGYVALGKAIRTLIC